ncbi:MAG TPA: LacI family transcriptional regulator [Chloroflexi bacterium]|jgi:LacI family transcriptional regulator|nr:LacI family transcriptional regulator [Chloroflexota bacterium]
MRSNRPTIKDVAKMAGVSFKTVSRVINGQDGVREETRERVLATIADLGYVVNYSARALAAGHNRTVGVVIPRITDPHTFHLAYHIGELGEKCDCDVIILTSPSLADKGRASSFIGHGIIGALLLIAPISLEPYLPIIEALSLPAVMAETQFVGESGELLPIPIPSVASDNRNGAREGIAHLIGLGHRRIGFIGGRDANQGRMRLMGYRDALRDYDIPLTPGYIRPGSWTWESGYAQANHLLDLPEPPTAIFCASDNMALGAMRAIKERDLRVPDDVSLLGFDDIPAAAMADPPLSTVRQPAEEMMRLAFDLLVREMDGEQVPPESHMLPTTLVVRSTCAPPPG